MARVELTDDWLNSRSAGGQHQRRELGIFLHSHGCHRNMVDHIAVVFKAKFGASSSTILCLRSVMAGHVSEVVARLRGWPVRGRCRGRGA